jgi:hypothetical protein
MNRTLTLAMGLCATFVLAGMLDLSSAAPPGGKAAAAQRRADEIRKRAEKKNPRVVDSQPKLEVDNWQNLPASPNLGDTGHLSRFRLIQVVDESNALIALDRRHKPLEQVDDAELEPVWLKMPTRGLVDGREYWTRRLFKVTTTTRYPVGLTTRTAVVLEKADNSVELKVNNPNNAVELDARIRTVDPLSTPQPVVHLPVQDVALSGLVDESYHRITMSRADLNKNESFGFMMVQSGIHGTMLGFPMLSRNEGKVHAIAWDAVVPTIPASGLNRDREYWTGRIFQVVGKKTHPTWQDQRLPLGFQGNGELTIPVISATPVDQPDDIAEHKVVAKAAKSGAEVNEPVADDGEGAPAIQPSGQDVAAKSDSPAQWLNESYDTTVRYVNGKKIWEEVDNKTGKVNWIDKEVARTAEYIELFSPERKSEIRLRAQRMEQKIDGKWQWVANGRWDTSATTNGKK